MDKVIRDGKVAVLVSPGYGAGWSTWNTDTPECLYDPIVVAWVEEGKPGPAPLDQYNNKYFYAGGVTDLIIYWLPLGTQFRVSEYDGSEHIVLASEEEWHTA